MKITRHGAASEITGSAYLVETDAARVPVDFGRFPVGANHDAKNVLPAKLLDQWHRRPACATTERGLEIQNT